MKVESGFDSPARSTMSKSKYLKEAEALEKIFKEGRASPRDLGGLVQNGLNFLSASYWQVLYAWESANQLNSEPIPMTLPTNCKLCDRALRGGQDWCHSCHQYCLVIAEGVIESESIRVGDFHLVYFPHIKEVDIIHIEGEFKTLARFPLEELTPEEAKRLAKKLKNYLIFQ